MNHENRIDENLIERSLQDYFTSEFPRPFPPAPAGRLNSAAQPYAFNARLALAASLLFIMALVWVWTNPGSDASSNGRLDKFPSASDAKRHRPNPADPMGSLPPMAPQGKP